MTYLAHTGHAQLGALWLSFVGWTLTAVALGLIPWRVWLVADREVISSGEAWVGLWRACFNSHTVVSDGFQVMFCRYIGLTEEFTPPEIVAGQILMLLSVLVGLFGNAGGVYSMRNVYFKMEKHPPVRVGFITTGALCLLAAVMSLVPLLWNLTSVVTNQTIRFPPEFNLPPAPVSQHVGCGIGVGMVGAALMVFAGIVFCMYRLPGSSRTTTELTVVPKCRSLPSVMQNVGALPIFKGKDNPGFESHEHL